MLCKILRPSVSWLSKTCPIVKIDVSTMRSIVPQGAILVTNGVSIWAILVTNRAWFLLSSLELGMFFLDEATFCIIIDKTMIIKSPSQICL